VREGFSRCYSVPLGDNAIPRSVLGIFECAGSEFDVVMTLLWNNIEQLVKMILLYYL